MQAFMDGFKPAEGGPHSDVPWWMRYAGKGAGVVGGGLAVFFGLSAAVSINPFCIVAGLWEIVAGILVISIEAPFCCVFLDFVQKFSTFMDVRPLWQKASVYLGLSFPGILLCTSFSSIVASVAIFVCAVLFGMQFLGKKGNQADMAAMAQQDETGMNAADDSAILDKDQYGQMQASREDMMTNVQPTNNLGSATRSDSMKSGLVGNIHVQDVESAPGNP